MGRVSWDEVRAWHGRIYTTKCKTSNILTANHIPGYVSNTLHGLMHLSLKTACETAIPTNLRKEETGIERY